MAEQAAVSAPPLARASAQLQPHSQPESQLAPKGPSKAAPKAPATAPNGRREEVLRALRSAHEPQSIAALAAQVQLHPNTVRFHLDSLIATGRARQADHGPRRRGRPALLYEAVRGMDPGGPRGYRTLAEILTIGVATLPDAQALGQEAGRRWGRQLATSMTSGSVLDRLVRLLDETGFAPERQDADGAVRIGLRHCPFLELAESHTQVVCPVHLGLMQGAMEEWDGARIVTRLEPFVEPDLCMAHLSAAADSG